MGWPSFINETWEWLLNQVLMIGIFSPSSIFATKPFALQFTKKLILADLVRHLIL